VGPNQTSTEGPNRLVILSCYVIAADMEETWRLWNTIEAWWPAILVALTNDVTNARTEAANTGIKQIKRVSVNRPGVSQSSPLSSPYPAHQRRPARGINPLTQQGNSQLRIARGINPLTQQGNSQLRIAPILGWQPSRH
jgi:hypothetical protein